MTDPGAPPQATTGKTLGDSRRALAVRGRVRKLLSRYGVELLVVFVGVWLSLLAEGWRQDRQEARGERESIARLSRDLEFDVRDLRSNLVRAEAGIAAGTWLLSHDLRSVAPDSLGAILWPLRACSRFIENASEYQSLKAAGKLGLIKNADARQRLVELYESREFLKWMHEIDCQQSSALFELISPLVEYRDLRPHETLDRLTPRISRVLVPDRLLRDTGSRNRVTELTVVRRRIVVEITDAIKLADQLRQTLNVGR
jgi:hypothetical protein